MAAAVSLAVAPPARPTCGAACARAGASAPDPSFSPVPQYALLDFAVACRSTVLFSIRGSQSKGLSMSIATLEHNCTVQSDGVPIRARWSICSPRGGEIAAQEGAQASILERALAPKVWKFWRIFSNVVAPKPGNHKQTYGCRQSLRNQTSGAPFSDLWFPASSRAGRACTAPMR